MKKLTFGLVCLVGLYAVANAVAASPELVKALKSQFSPGKFPAEKETEHARFLLQELKQPQAGKANPKQGMSLHEMVAKELPNLNLKEATFALRAADVDLLSMAKSPLFDAKLPPVRDLSKPMVLEKSLLEQLSSSPSSKLLFDPATVPPSKLLPDAAAIEAAKKLLLPETKSPKKTR